MEFKASRRRFRRESWLISASALVTAPVALYFLKGVSDLKLLLGVGFATSILTAFIYEYRARRMLVDRLDIGEETIAVRRRNVVEMRWTEIQEAAFASKGAAAWSLYDGKRKVHFGFDGLSEAQKKKAHGLILDRLAASGLRETRVPLAKLTVYRR